jgi:hypothetical protein
MRKIIAGITVNAYESRAQCERSGTNPASDGKYTGLRKSTRAGVIKGTSHEGEAPEGKSDSGGIWRPLRGDEKIYSSYAW